LSSTSADVDDNENATVRLTSNTNVELRTNACRAGDTHDLQVVRLAGAQVTHSTAAMGNGTFSIAPNVTSRAGTPLLLYSWRTSSNGSDACERLLRGSVPSSTNVQFDRGDGNTSSSCANDGNTDVAFQRVHFPAGTTVQQVTMRLVTNATSGVASVTAVDPTRTLVLTGAVTHSGNGLGETQLDFAQSPSHYVARFSLNAAGDVVTANRVSAPDSARYTVFVVELDPR
jgi:hypothetical protein